MRRFPQLDRIEAVLLQCVTTPTIHPDSLTLKFCQPRGRENRKELFLFEPLTFISGPAMTEAPAKPELDEIQPVATVTEVNPKLTCFQVLRSVVLTWSVFLVMAYACLVSFSSSFMSNGKSQFQRVAQSIGGSK